MIYVLMLFIRRLNLECCPNGAATYKLISVDFINVNVIELRWHHAEWFHADRRGLKFGVVCNSKALHIHHYKQSARDLSIILFKLIMTKWTGFLPRNERVAAYAIPNVQKNIPQLSLAWSSRQRRIPNISVLANKKKILYFSVGSIAYVTRLLLARISTKAATKCSADRCVYWWALHLINTSIGQAWARSCSPVRVSVAKINSKESHVLLRTTELYIIHFK